MFGRDRSPFGERIPVIIPRRTSAMTRATAAFLFALLTLVLLSCATRGLGQEAKNVGKDSDILMSGKWQGTWLCLAPKHSGYVFFAELQVKVQADGAVEGK